jgi:tRNA isopentenyl-2-thiomethyl-A-37 hydroxylase MiaE
MKLAEVTAARFGKILKNLQRLTNPKIIIETLFLAKNYVNNTAKVLLSESFSKENG